MQLPRRFVAPSLLLAAVLIAACGGDDDDSSTTTASAGASVSASASASGTTASGSPVRSPSATSAASSSATTATGSPAASPSASASATPTADASSVFRDLTKDRATETQAVTYDLVLVDDGTTRTGTWRIVQDPPKSLVAFAIDGSDGGTFWIIDDGKSSIICFDTDSEPGQCVKTGDSSLSDSLVPSVVDVDETFDGVENAPNVTEVAGRTIAGRSARCFEYDDTTNADTGTICLDASDGILLALKNEGIELTAIDVSTTVNADAFAPPFAVLDLGG
ncbi:MAG: hypothetical protein KC495_08775 [Dehalococcoidia bacterium]|nr:hypothetical protein [Dehalococcoidia bacterium]